MLRRPAILLLSLLVVLSVGGILCAQAQAASASACCKYSCPKSQHHEPSKCCKVGISPATAEVATAHQATPEHLQLATASFATHTFARLELRTIAFRELRPPLRLVLSPEQLCSLQI
jgi:hypothetical protein